MGDVKSTSVRLSVYISVYMTIYISNIILEAVLRRAGGPSGPLGPCGPCWGPSAPSRVAISKLRTFNFEKLEIRGTLIAISHYIEAKFDYSYFIIFLRYSSKILHKKFQVISSKNEGVALIFPIPNEIKIRKNHCHAFTFGRNDFRFFVYNLRTKTQN